MAAVDTHVGKPNQNTQEQEQDKALLGTFWRLADPNDNVRLQGASDLFEIVIRKQKQHNKSGASTLYCSEVEYTLQRLVKGLASGRKGARLGYVTVLAELLEKVPRISLDEILTLVQDHLVVKGKKEERDSIFGQVFAYLAIIQSGRLQRSDEKYTVELIQSLLTLCDHKSYLQELCCKAVIDVICKTSENVFLDNVWPKLKPRLKVGWEDTTAETLALLIVCQKQFPDVVKPKFVQSHWGHSNVLDESNFHHIGRILVKSTINCHPNVHFLCDLILSQAVLDKAKVPLFWQIVVDESLCSARQECKFLALKLLERIIPLCDVKLIKAVFSQTLIRVFINSLSNRQGFLHKAAVQFSENLPNAVRQVTDAKAQVAVIQCLLSSPGHLLFDDITKSKTIHFLVSTLTADGVRIYMKWLKKLFESGTEKIRLEPDLDSDRRWVCMQILSLIRNPRLQREDDWMQDACQFLLLHSFFRVTAPDSSIVGCKHVLPDPVSDQLRKQICPYFYSAVHALSSFTQASRVTDSAANEGSGSSEHRPLGMTSEGELWVLVLMRYTQQLLQSASVDFAVEFTEQVQAEWDKMYALVEKIEKKKSKKSAVGVPFQLLFIHVGLQMLSDPKQSVEILEDLHGCYDRALQRRKSAKKNEEEEPDWVVVVTEILLSLLSKSSHLLRMVVDNVFKMICPHLTKEALGLLLNVLDPTGGAEVTNLEVADDSDEEMEGENENEEEGMEEEEEEEDDEDTKKPESKPNKDDEEQGSEDSEDDDEEDDDDDDDDAAVGEVDEALRANLKAALGNAAKDSDEDEAKESDDEFDDDTMMKIDTLLERVFLQHKTSSMTRKEMDNAMLHFKLRVLDLIEIFIKRNESSPLILDLFEPLLVVAKVASVQKNNQILAEKAFRIYRNRLCAGGRRYPHGIADQKEDIHKTIENVMQLAMKGHSVQMVSLASSGCLFLMKILKGNVVLSEPSPLQTRRQRSAKKKDKNKDDQEEEGSTQTCLLDEERIASLYNNALEDFMTRKGTCLHPVLFSDLINRFPAISWQLLDPLIKYVTQGVQLYRKTQACHLLSLLLARRPFMGDVKVWPKQSKSTLKVIKQALESMQGEDSEVKPKFLLQLLELITQFAKLTHHIEQPPKFDSVTSMLMELKKKPTVSKSREILTASTKAQDAIENRLSISKKQRQRGKQKNNKRKKSNRKARMRKLKQANKQ
ncbi:myb-binding protein 1A-like protein isoform X2 [Amphiura filiformis]|uniref:myb-binding protein 1A-like protein isoform X2 n=1 Tax=Amphiura filiformis TaxID=82378 RepID=UPI003B227EFA